ncbi:uncharacterized protein RSE6_11436 [Rhynchosporium secalis]|uniref:Subtelomeric hrmA-associated cluster protein AFUB-079030/YDR124W-like helical bundle domain-containing protein n=1 Tax=Rhynchosporium secalis TaxID=38038 RepID=A0A1E1MMZ1_RHYSE|nr:uncharacterized protein RSE6_11436 [Rhynchosporium secalis]
MVQQLPESPLQPGNLYQRESPWSRNERNTFLDTSQERLPPTTTVRQAGPVASSSLYGNSIDSALKEYVGIPGIKNWALIIQTDEESGPRTFTSQNLKPYRNEFFNEPFRQSFTYSALKANAHEEYPKSSYHQDAGVYSQFDSDTRKHNNGSEYIRRPHRKSRSEESERDGSIGAKRRRKVYGAQSREKSNEDLPVAHSTQKQDLKISDDAQVEAFYTTRFKNMQQASCKIMGKAFVKLVEPKKQTHHPYTKGDDKAPPWWPKGTGDDAVRHKEPDHLLRRERLILLVHILKMIVEPVHLQCPEVRKLKLDVKALEAATLEAMSTWFADKEHPENEQKRAFLKEIFKVAKQQERYKDGGLNADTIIHVRSAERTSADEDSDGDSENCAKYEQDDDAGDSSVHIPTPPESLVSPSLSHNQQFQQAEDHNMRSMRGLPLRYPASSVDQMGYEDQSFRSMGPYQPHSPNPMDPGRRNYIPAFPNPSQNIFPNAWPPNPVTSAPVSQYYAASPQASLPSFPVLPQPQPQQPGHIVQPMHQYHDGIARYDNITPLGHQTRTGSLGHAHHQMPNPNAFQDYMGNENTQYSHHEMKNEHQHLHS